MSVFDIATIHLCF